jgi:hypothetical protein
LKIQKISRNREYSAREMENGRLPENLSGKNKIGQGNYTKKITEK